MTSFSWLIQLPDNTVSYSRAGVELYRQGQPFGLHGWPHLTETGRHENSLTLATRPDRRVRIFLADPHNELTVAAV